MKLKKRKSADSLKKSVQLPQNCLYLRVLSKLNQRKHKKLAKHLKKAAYLVSSKKLCKDVKKIL